MTRLQNKTKRQKSNRLDIWHHAVSIEVNFQWSINLNYSQVFQRFWTILNGPHCSLSHQKAWSEQIQIYFTWGCWLISLTICCILLDLYLRLFNRFFHIFQCYTWNPNVAPPRPQGSWYKKTSRYITLAYLFDSLYPFDSWEKDFKKFSHISKTSYPCSQGPWPWLMVKT